MKRIFSCILAAVFMMIILSACDFNIPEEENTGAVKEYEPYYVYEKYTSKELEKAAERLFDTDFSITEEYEPLEFDETQCTVYTLHSESMPFDIHIYSDYSDYGYGADEGVQYYYPHARCNYYERMMSYKRDAAAQVAEFYGLDVTVSGQDAVVTVSSYDQLSNVYKYLEKTNELYNFQVIEEELTGLLRDIRTRPTLSVCLDEKVFGRNDEIVLLYYTINHDTYYYTKSALLSDIKEKYINLLDSLSLKDSLITDEIRAEIVKPMITELRIDGVPVEVKECNGFTLDPNFTFDYDWKLNGYYADIRICAPAKDYDLPPDSIGDDRNFRYLVELLGGTYSSELTMQMSTIIANYSAEWFLGGKTYTASTYCQEYIPTESYFWINDFYMIPTSAVYSKEMWGLEDGYDASDYYVRMNIDDFSAILGVAAEVNYEEGWLNLVTPEGYFLYEPPIEYPEKFFCERVSLESTHYIIYKNDGTVLEEAYTEDFNHAACEQLDENIVHLDTSEDRNTVHYFYDTEAGIKSQCYENVGLISWPLVVYCPSYSRRIVVSEVFGEGRSMILAEDAVSAEGHIISYAELSYDNTEITVTYSTDDGDVTRTFDLGSIFAESVKTKGGYV